VLWLKGLAAHPERTWVVEAISGYLSPMPAVLSIHAR
jgi:hypothetical protein